MDKRLETWEFISRSLSEQQDVMLIYVVESIGSSPGRQGFFMAINSLGQLHGSIGGGIMEHKFTQLSLDQLKQEGEYIALRKQVHNKQASRDQSGMICSGEQTLAMYKLRRPDLAVVNDILSSYKQFAPGTLILDNTGLQFLQEHQALRHTYEFSSIQRWSYTEPTALQNRLHIVGGGHCCLALSRVMSDIGFLVNVYEEREHLPTLSQNKYANRISLVEAFNDLSALLPQEAPDEYVVVMTLGYRTDMIAVKALVRKNFAYIGLLGSRSKIDQMMEELRASGCSEHELQKISAPAGLLINSRTPEEIAVSIAAQIIQLKNSPQTNITQS